MPDSEESGRHETNSVLFSSNEHARKDKGRFRAIMRHVASRTISLGKYFLSHDFVNRDGCRRGGFQEKRRMERIIRLHRICTARERAETAIARFIS